MTSNGAREPDHPLLSIGLPVYNGLPFLEQALDSLCNGDLDDVEIIVCDNASTDETAACVRDYAQADSRIRYVRNPENVGASRNYNKTFSLALGRYFRWAASDDFESPGALKKCVEALEDDHELVLAFPETKLVDQGGRELEVYDDGDGWSAATPAERFRFSLSQWGYCNVVFGVMRTEVLGRTVLLGDYPASDLVWQSDMAIRGPFRQITGEYYHRRIHDGATDSFDDEGLARFYVPTGKKTFDTKHLRMFRELTSVVWRADTSAGQKARMLAALARKGRWTHRELAADLKTLLRRRSLAT